MTPRPPDPGRSDQGRSAQGRSEGQPVAPVRDRGGHQLSELLHLVGAGRARVPDGPPPGGRQPTGPAPVRSRLSPGVLAPPLGRVRELLDALGPGQATQVDGTTCGSAALVVTAASGDPALARRLARPGAFDAAQLLVKRASTRRALLGLPWPGALGTPPWAAARVARCGPFGYTHRLVVDTRQQSTLLLDRAVAWARAGVPVPLYTGGDTRRGLAAAVPRHVVVLTSPDGRTLEVYEPGSGRLHVVDETDLRTGGTRRAALGGWSHVTWVLLPVVPRPQRGCLRSRAWAPPRGASRSGTVGP